MATPPPLPLSEATTPPTATADLPAADVVLEYAGGFGSGSPLDPRCGEAARALVPVAVCSGLCVAVCFAPMAFEMPGAVLHLIVFAATIALAVRAGAKVRAAVERGGAMLALDSVAAIGLTAIGVAPVVGLSQSIDKEPGAVLLGLAFLAMAFTTARHVMLYRVLARWSAAASPTGYRPAGRGLKVLGWVKAWYEGLWLTCCGGALLLLGGRSLGSSTGSDLEAAAVPLAILAFCGCLGYVGVWIWMIIAHARLASRLSR
jgi:hypothetical protein